jgi:hypothetical protein
MIISSGFYCYKEVDLDRMSVSNSLRAPVLAFN